MPAAAPPAATLAAPPAPPPAALPAVPPAAPPTAPPAELVNPYEALGRANYTATALNLFTLPLVGSRNIGLPEEQLAHVDAATRAAMEVAGIRPTPSHAPSHASSLAAMPGQQGLGARLSSIAWPDVGATAAPEVGAAAAPEVGAAAAPAAESAVVRPPSATLGPVAEALEVADVAEDAAP